MRLYFFLSTLAVLAACSANSEGPTPSDPPTIAEAPFDAGAAPDAAASPDAAPPIAISKGCSVAPANVGALTKRSTTAAGKARSYQLSVPAGLAPKQPAALVFTLHGASDTTPANMRDWFAVESQMPGALFLGKPERLLEEHVVRGPGPARVPAQPDVRGGKPARLLRDGGRRTSGAGLRGEGDRRVLQRASQVALREGRAHFASA